MKCESGFRKCVYCGIIKSVPNMTYYVVRGERRPKKMCKKCSGARLRKRQKVVGSKAWLNRKHSRLRRRAKVRGIEVCITRRDCDLLFLQERCFYCGEISKKRTVDRINPKKGYSIKNCVPCCWECNRLKGKIDHVKKDRLFKILSRLL